MPATVRCARGSEIDRFAPDSRSFALFACVRGCSVCVTGGCQSLFAAVLAGSLMFSDVCQCCHAVCCWRAHWHSVLAAALLALASQPLPEHAAVTPNSTNSSRCCRTVKNYRPPVLDAKQMYHDGSADDTVSQWLHVTEALEMTSFAFALRTAVVCADCERN